MIHEKSRRRDLFREGTVILLANGEPWTFPIGARSSESELRPRGLESWSRQDAEYQALLQEYQCAEDEADSKRAELALAIYLLRSNYDLLPDEIAELLTIPDRNSTSSVALRDRLSALARENMATSRWPSHLKAESEHAGHRPRFAIRDLWERLRSFRHAEHTA